jgi:hypothetical protein
MNPLEQAALDAGTQLAAGSQMPPVTPEVSYVPVDQAVATAKGKRVAKATAGSYWDASLSEDDPMMGVVRAIAGDTMAPDMSWFPGDPKVWPELSAGIPEEYHEALYNTKSAAHAVYVKSNLMDKMKDQENLGDLSGWGQAARMAGGFVQPSNLALMATTMGISSFAGGVNSLARATAALNKAKMLPAGAARTAALEAATASVAKAAEAASKVKAAALPMAAGAAENAAFERIRQDFNYEHSNSQTLEAGLFGLAFTTPFAIHGVRKMDRLRRVAELEKDVLHVIHREQTSADIPVTPEEAALAAKVKTLHDEVRAAENGPPAEAGVDAEVAHLNGETPDPHVDVDADELHPAPEADAASPDAATPADPAGGTPVAPETFPEGFGPGSVGAAQLAHPPAIGIDPVYMRSGRLDISATLNRQSNEVIQELGWLLVKEAIGNSKTVGQGWAASERKRNLARRTAGNFHAERTGAYNEAARTLALNPKRKIQFEDEFNEAVTRLTRGDENVLTEYANIAPHLQRASAAMKKVYADLLDLAQKAGVEGAENITPNESYVNRVWNHGNIRRLKAKLGEMEVLTLLANSMKGTISKAALAQGATKITVAKSFLTAVEKLEHSHSLQDIMLHGQDMNTLRTELNRAGLSSSEIDAIVDVMFEVKESAGSDAGRPANLKYRFKLDENHAETINGESYRVSDMFENDSRILVDRYVNSMAGHTALAENGITSRRVFDQWLKRAEDEKMAKGQDVNEFNRATQLVKDMYDNITGRPMSMQSFNTTDKLVRTMHAYTRSAVLGQLGIAAFFEVKNMVALAGVKAALTQMKTFGDTIRALKAGHRPSSELSRDIREMWAFGTEQASAYARSVEVSDHLYDKSLGKFEDFANKASHVVDRLSGNSWATSATREWSARSSIQKFADFAHGRTKLTEKKRDRMVGQGVARGMQDEMLDAMKLHSKRDGDRVTEIDWEKWSNTDPRTYNAFQLAVERDVRDMIQEHDIGETMPWMHTTVGKIFGELRTFNLVGHAKQFLKNAHYHDQTSMSVMMFSIVGEALAYALQTSINFAHNPEELEKRLTPERIAKAILARSAALGVLPMLIGTPAAMAGYKLSPGTTANTDNRDFLVPPSLALLQKASGALTGTIPGLAGFNGQTATKREVSDSLSVFPGGNLTLMRNMNDFLSGHFPTQEPRVAQ